MRSLIIVAAIATCLACGSKPAPEPGSGDAPAPAAEPSAEPSAEPIAQPSAEPSGETREEIVEGLTMIVPKEWARASVRSPMRKGEFVLPGPGGEARLVVYRFEGGAGDAASNIARWQSQIELEPGVEPEVSELQVNGLKVTSVAARGRFAGQAMPGMPAQPPIDDARLFAAAIEGSGDPYYLKLVGPAATLDPWAPAWTELLAKLAAQ